MNMKTKFHLLTLFLVLLPGINRAAAQDIVFTYQGPVTDNGSNLTAPASFPICPGHQHQSRPSGRGTANLNGPFVISYNIISGGSGYDIATYGDCLRRRRFRGNSRRRPYGRSGHGHTPVTAAPTTPACPRSH